MKLSTAILSSLLGFMPVAIADVRRHEAHEHSVVTMSIAMEGQEVYIEIKSPAINIVGFESRPRNESQEKSLSEARVALRDPANLLALPADAKCTLKSVFVTSPLFDAPVAHAAHGHAHHADHDHHEPEHAELLMAYAFRCAAPEKVTEIRLPLFARYPHVRRVKAEWIVSTAQGSTDVTALRPVIELPE